MMNNDRKSFNFCIVNKIISKLANQLSKMRTNRSVPMLGKTVYYQSDGSGRDSYIKNINGGMLSHDRIHQLHNIISKPRSEKRMAFGIEKPLWRNQSIGNGQTKFNHYVSDGSGRDYYVKLCQGGNSNPYDWRNHVDYKFRYSLRSEQKLSQVTPNRNNPENDFFRASIKRINQMSRVSSKTKAAHQNKYRNQISLSERLAKPKVFLKPLPIKAYFNQKNTVLYVMKTIC